MPDLSRKAVHQFWHDYNDKMIYRVIAFMEGVETWTADGDLGLETSLLNLGNLLDEITGIEITERDLFIQIAGSLTTGRTLRLLQSVDVASPGAASKMLIHAEEASQRADDSCGLFLRRNIIFERLRLLGRVFSQERFDLVIKALEGDYE